MHPDLPAPDQAEAFRQQVYRATEGRERIFPWRYHPDPYGIWISECMLQQTRTTRVLEYFPRFLQTFPDVHSLAKADLASVLELWQGLGYNRRGRYLHEAAKKVERDWNGILPADHASLVSLPGIGPQTAGAILCYAWNLPVPFVETNIRAALIQGFHPHDTHVPDSRIQELSALTMDRNRPREWYYRLVDFGVKVKQTHGNPARRSASYRRQSVFEGSVRQVRGSILRMVLAGRGVSVHLLGDAVARDVSRTGDPAFPEDFRKALKGLQEEGMVHMAGDSILPGTGAADA